MVGHPLHFFKLGWIMPNELLSEPCPAKRHAGHIAQPHTVSANHLRTAAPNGDDRHRMAKAVLLQDPEIDEPCLFPSANDSEWQL